jgi:hypothetical protein
LVGGAMSLAWPSCFVLVWKKNCMGEGGVLKK